MFHIVRDDLILSRYLFLDRKRSALGVQSFHSDLERSGLLHGSLLCIEGSTDLETLATEQEHVSQLGLVGNQ